MRHRGAAARLILVAAVLLLGVVAYPVVRTLWELHAVERDAERLQSQLEDSDLDGARASLDRLVEHAHDAHAHAHGPAWTVLVSLPLVGDDASALQDLARAVDQVAGAAPAVVDELDGVVDGGLRTPAGGVDLQVVAGLEPTMRRLVEVADRGLATVRTVDPDRLPWPLASRAKKFVDGLRLLRTVADGGVTATRLAPELLGADGPRTYLLVVQNNAEIRSTGGLPGSASLLRVDDGDLELADQGSANDIVEHGRPIAPYLPGEEETFTSLLVTDFRDTTFTPDFPRAASLMTAYADQTYDQRVDGVISVDPVTLAAVLGAVGPVSAAGTELDEGNAVRQLLLEPYVRFATNPGQDRFFRLAAQGILDGLVSAEGDQAALLRVLGEAVAQRRLLFHSRDATVQRQIEDYPIAGALPGDTGRPEVGAYLDDSTEAKMQYFLRYRTGLYSRGCDADGRQEVRSSLRLHNTFEGNPRELPPSVVGYGKLVPQGTMAMQLRLFAPYGGKLTGLSVGGKRVEVGQTEVYDRQSTQLRIELAPGERTEVLATFVGAPGEDGDPRLQWTPGIRWGPTQLVVDSHC